jgi:hypothetical protein
MEHRVDGRSLNSLFRQNVYAATVIKGAQDTLPWSISDELMCGCHLPQRRRLGSIPMPGRDSWRNAAIGCVEEIRTWSCRDGATACEVIGTSLDRIYDMQSEIDNQNTFMADNS